MRNLENIQASIEACQRLKNPPKRVYTDNKTKSKARKDTEDFSLIFEKACDKVRKGDYAYDQNAN